MRHFEGPLFRSLKCCPPAKHAKLGVKPRKFVRRWDQIAPLRQSGAPNPSNARLAYPNQSSEPATISIR